MFELGSQNMLQRREVFLLLLKESTDVGADQVSCPLLLYLLLGVFNHLVHRPHLFVLFLNQFPASLGDVEVLEGPKRVSLVLGIGQFPQRNHLNGLLFDPLDRWKTVEYIVLLLILLMLGYKSL